MATIYAGGKPITGLGKRQFDLLSFALQYPGWHEMPVRQVDIDTVESLSDMNVITINCFRQFKFEDTRG